MSHEMIPTPTLTLVCDLCGKPIDDYANKDRTTLNWGQGSSVVSPKPRRFTFFRSGHGDRTSGAPKGDYRSWQWDFHGECLVGVLEPLINREDGE